MVDKRKVFPILN